MHALVQLRPLEEKYRDILVVIGVHSAKFMAEKATEALRDAVLRYDIRHPVVNDRDFKLWNAYAVRAWPTMMFIDPRGKVIGKHEGEVPVEDFDHLIGQMVAEYDAQGLLDHQPISWQLEKLTPGLTESSPLAFPGKVLADVATNRLFIADSNHHRIIIATLDGHVGQVVGELEAGLADGSERAARFNNPQGLALNNNNLYIADTGNHAIRKLDLSTWQTVTLAGTGEQNRDYDLTGGAGLQTTLNSPWDLAYWDEALYIAMAGFHQIWRLDLKTAQIKPWAGTGYEAIKDGSLKEAFFAQPSGISYYNGCFYTADSETSSIRQISLDGTVRSPVGSGLFTFGDRDGTGEEALLQHPLGVSAGPEGIYIADSYNNKIKRLEPATRHVITLYGDGSGGYLDGPGSTARFNEPGGLSLAGNRLYIADTNNHLVRLADLTSGEVTTLQLKNLSDK